MDEIKDVLSRVKSNPADANKVAEEFFQKMHYNKEVIGFAVWGACAENLFEYVILDFAKKPEKEWNCDAITEFLEYTDMELLVGILNNIDKKQIAYHAANSFLNYPLIICHAAKANLTLLMQNLAHQSV